MNRQHNLDHLRRAANGTRASDETPAIKAEITSRAQDLAENGNETIIEDEKALRRRIHWSILPVALFPGCMYYITCWYPRRQIGFPIAIFYAGGALGAALANLLNAPIVTISTGNNPAVSANQTSQELEGGPSGSVGSDWVVLIWGLLTIVLSILTYFFVPNFPASDDKILESPTGDSSTIFKNWQTWYIGDDATRNTKEDYSSKAWKEAFTDMKTYLFTLVHTTNVVPRDGLALVQRVTAIAYARRGRVIDESKLDNLDRAIYSLLYVPPVALAVVTILGTSILSDRFNQRAYFMMGFSLLSISSFIIFIATGEDQREYAKAKYAACFLGSVGTWTSGALSWAWIANSFEGLYKRAIVIGIIVGVGNIISGLTIPAVVTWQEEFPGKIGDQATKTTFSAAGSIYFLVLICVHIASILLTRWYLDRENRRKQVNAKQLHGDTQQGVGLTTEDEYGDKSTGFKYIL
ncbi:hypothetical protein H072_5090 [Dactylellina haptotyla CBS 200.50]|uniref:Major facilitator superfamily (MFS) profile domain-containing protein n=1 Tax=Dactylellina haptotyla (strain CBS 200.50) TaxID=1284197 RepID=S8ADD8_DACHA|nr:hypothetical protein H072_5090 [Dactylellina haptotyla CBS 200.50]